MAIVGSFIASIERRKKKRRGEQRAAAWYPMTQVAISHVHSCKEVGGKKVWREKREDRKCN